MQSSKPIFDQGYAEWKAWESDGFGKTDSSTRAYYAAEMRRAGLSSLAGKRVLEIGYGNGALLEYLRQEGAAVVGVEAQADLVSRARAGGFDCHGPDALADMERQSFDVVLMFDVLEHVIQSEIPALLAQVAQLLKPRGVVLARFPNGDSPLSLANQNGDPTHVTYLGSAKARYFAEEAGLAVRSLGRPAAVMNDPVLKRRLVKLLVWLPRKLVEAAVRVLFFPSHEIHYFSSNLVLVATRSEASRPRETGR